MNNKYEVNMSIYDSNNHERVYNVSLTNDEKTERLMNYKY